MTNTRLRRLPRAAASLTALLVVLAGVPMALAAVAGARFGSPHPFAGATPPWSWSFGDVESGLSEPLSNETVIDVVLRLALLVGWLGVAVLAATVLTEVAHQIRHRGMPTPHVRGVGWAQAAARWIVAGLIVVPSFVQSPLRLSALDPTEPALTAPSHVVEVGSVASRTGDDASVAVPSHEAPHRRSAGQNPVHVVRPGESVYGIASALVNGDERRTVDVAHQILDLNLGRAMADGQQFSNPAYIEVGWKLVLPADMATPAPVTDHATGSDVHEVSAGESLSSIARSHYDDGAEWITIWDANQGRTMNDGRVFDDPNLIVPGWQLAIPSLDGAPAGDEMDASPEPESRRARDDAGARPDTGSGTHDDNDGDRTVDTPIDSSIGDPPPRGSSTSPTTTPPEASAPAHTPDAASPRPADRPPDDSIDHVAARLDGTVGLERAALLSAGIISCAATIRLRRLRSADVGSRLPEPPADVAALHRRLLHDPASEREIRLAAALRAIAACVTAGRGPGAEDELPRIGVARLSRNGDVTVDLTSVTDLPSPWVGSGCEWSLPADVPVDDIAEDARRAGDPSHALVAIGVTPAGDDLFVDLEAAGILQIGGAAESAANILRAIATSLSVAGHAEACHLIGGESATVGLDTPNSHVADSVDSGVELASGLVGGTRQQELTTFELRARRTGGDIWEPAVLLLDESFRSADGPDDEREPWPADTTRLFAPAHGMALVTTLVPPGADSRWSLEPHSEGWLLTTTVGAFRVDPIGLEESEAAQLGTLLETAARAPVADDAEWSSEDEPFHEPPHDIVVSLFGGITVADRSGDTASFSRSKSVELLAWLVTHRDRSTRTAARTALWDLDVRDATFANVVSEARRTLARLVTPPEGEWLARTLTEELPLDHRVVSDSELISARLDHARRVRDHDDAIELLGPVLDLITDAPFAGTDYLWPDAEGITSNLVLLAVGACTELAGRALRVGDIDTLFAATDRGLRVLPGHEEMIALRMRAHARSGDSAGVKQEWAAYERTILADPWSDGEPAPRLQAVRAELLGRGR